MLTGKERNYVSVSKAGREGGLADQCKGKTSGWCQSLYRMLNCQQPLTLRKVTYLLG